MELPDLVRAVLSGNLLAARQWVADARRAQLQWPACTRPLGLDNREMTVAAALAELLATRAGLAAPSWTAAIGANNEPLFLDPGIQSMPRSLERSRTDAPEALRKRNLFALPDFLDVR
jgi:hypothetical protein